MTDEVDDFLEHFGVKGMHWGVQRAAQGAVKGAIKADHAIEKIHSKAVNSKVNQAGLKADAKIKNGLTNAHAKLATSTPSSRAAYSKAVGVSKDVAKVAGIVAGAGAITLGGHWVAEHLPEIAGTVKLASSLAANHKEDIARGAKFAQEGLRESGFGGIGLSAVKVAKGAYQVSKLK